MKKIQTSRTEQQDNHENFFFFFFFLRLLFLIYVQRIVLDSIVLPQIYGYWHMLSTICSYYFLCTEYNSQKILVDGYIY